MNILQEIRISFGSRNAPPVNYLIPYLTPLKKTFSLRCVCRLRSITSHNSSGQYHAFLRSPTGVFTDLGTLGGDWSLAYGVNKWGQVVGSARTTASSGSERAIAALYKGWPAIQDLNSCIQPGGWELRAAHAINETGHIVGWGYTNGLARAFLLTPQ